MDYIVMQIRKINHEKGYYSEIKVTIVFRWNFVHYLSYQNFNFDVNKGVPMLIKEHWGIENALFWQYLVLIKRRIPSNKRRMFERDSWELTCINPSTPKGSPFDD